MDGVGSSYFAKTADRSTALRAGMTRGEWLLTQKYATWMDGDKSGYSAKTADPLPQPSPGAPVGMTR